MRKSLLSTALVIVLPLASQAATGQAALHERTSLDLGHTVRDGREILVSAGKDTATNVDDPSFACLDGPGPLEVVDATRERQFEPSVEAGKRFDARGATFIHPGYYSWHQVGIRDGDTTPADICWAGGYFTNDPFWHGLDVSWQMSKDGVGGHDGIGDNTTTGSAYGEGMVWTGIHAFNIHDGIRTTDSNNHWTVQHSWIEYARDDCVENDHKYSGTIYDTLFDGCYVGISTRGSKDDSAAGQTIKFDKVLMRLEPMPEPYKWSEKTKPLLYPNGSDGQPFGHGHAFKIERENTPEFSITNSVFLFQYESGFNVFPPKESVSECADNIIIWLDGPDTAPTGLQDDFPGCFTIITDRQAGLDVWAQRVVDWHRRHPGVGADQKPARPECFTWPRFGENMMAECGDIDGAAAGEIPAN